MDYAEVSVNSPVARRQTFSYAIPVGLTVEVGQAVWVPFGDKQLQGIVMELSFFPAVEETREILGVIDPRPLISPERVRLARWISDYYLAPLFDSVALMLSPAFKRRVLTYFSLAPAADGGEISSLTPEQKQVLGLLSGKTRVGQRQIENALGKRKAQGAIAQLIRLGLAVRSYELEAVRVKPRREPSLSLAVSPDKARELCLGLRKTAPRQAELLDFLLEHDAPVLWIEVRSEINAAKATANALAGKGIIAMETVTVRREPLAPLNVAPSAPIPLTDAQSAALASLKTAINGSGKSNNTPEVFLLHGVTGSGKTEVYLQALAEAVKQGQRGIVLVPEISLTPQTIERFSARFPGRVAVLHSGLSLGEQYDEWQRVRNGDFDVVIGPRSAVFAPQPDLGLVILDEEHEWTYKQTDMSPRYHARSVALKLAELTGAVLLLGSATPDIESYYHACRGDYHLLELPERVVPYYGAPLPEVQVVDLRDELKSGNRSIFSRALSQAVTEAVSRGEQVILFLNRRGGATFVQCRNCGYVVRCRRCSVVMSYHFDENSLVCHQCNYRMPVLEVCPECRSRRIKFLGTGTQKLEQAAAEAFQQARILRWDSDATRDKGAHQAKLNAFRNHEADILIGTQMIAKGLDLPLVTLVGVVNADISLNLPDFRAGERTFQILAQVLGRAGRGPSGGRVVIQTYCPENYAIQAAASHDYARFYELEIEYRKKLRNPPFSHLACLTYSHSNDEVCHREAERLQERFSMEIASRGIDNISLIGPAPAYVPRLRGRYRWQVILRGADIAAFLSQATVPQGWVIDIDPVGVA